ncbi:hypothetical protein [Lacihabitans lacunae]|uniref:DUF5723 domain-containing protein n=1 Tax=Lacihabitans lacunae TaxID=1028214 RepID=A0ABV7YYD9_9BACT
MKKLILFLSISLSLHAQSDSLNVTFSEEKVEVFEKTTLIDEYEKAFGGGSEFTSGLRFRIVFNPMTGNTIVPQFQFEQKVFKRNTLTLKYGHANSMNTNLGFEFRRYNIEKSPSTYKSNIVGEYVSFFVDKNAHFLEISEFGGANKMFLNRKDFFYGLGAIGVSKGIQLGNILTFGIKGGLRFGKEGTVNSEKNWVYDRSSNIVFTPFISSFSEVGLGFLFPLKNKFTLDRHEVIGSQQNMKDMWRVNLLNLIYLDSYKLNLAADLAYERKIKQSSFSLVSNLKVGLSNHKEFIGVSERDTIIKDYSNIGKKYLLIDFENNAMRVWEGMTAFNQELRYYPGMKKRMLKGKSGNNLNGFFVGLFGELTLMSRYFNRDSYDQIKGFDKLATQKYYGIEWGYQVKLSKNAFLSIIYNFGLKSNSNNFSRSSQTIYLSEPSARQAIYYTGALKLGFAK